MIDLENKVRFGIAGWSYPDWSGYVYPRGTKDQLEFVSRYVDVVEINTTFYRPVSARMAESWVRRTSGAPGFGFSAKLHQDVTHGGVINPAACKEFLAGLAPIAAAGRLTHLLAQFRYDFADSPDTREHLRKIRDAYGDFANLTLELRHSSWQGPAALEFLKTLGVSVAALDYPMANNSFNMRASGIGVNSYFRLHGRNAKAWFSKGAGRDETYNYLYSKPELEGLVARILEIAKMSASLTVVANNHYQGKEMANVLQLKSMTTGRKVPVPGGLKTHYPDLAEIAEPGDARDLL